MNRITVMAWVFGLVTAAALTVLAEPELTLTENSFDFGYVPQNSKVSHVFWLHATGDETVRIEQVKPGCGCTKVPLENDVLEPGDSTRLEIIFSTRRYTYRTVKRPSIRVAGLAKPYIIDIISYVVTRPDSTYPLMMKPYKLELSQYGETVRDRASLVITNVSDLEYSISLVAGIEDYGTVSLPQKIGPGEKGELELVLNEAVLGETFEKSITIELNDEHHSRYTIPVRRIVRDPNVDPITAPGGGR